MIALNYYFLFLHTGSRLKSGTGYNLSGLNYVKISIPEELCLGFTLHLCCSLKFQNKLDTIYCALF